MASRLKGPGAVGVAVIGLVAIAFVGNLEGLRLAAYKDVVGVWTVCYGETKGIKGGMKFTKEQCDVMFIDGLARHEAGMRKCLTFPDQLPEKTYVALLSFTYNVGTGGFCKSTVRRKANAGDLKGACNALMLWVKPKAITGRRMKEKKLCLEGVKEGLPNAD